MNYDFTGVCEDQIEKLEKRLNSFKKNCLKEYSIGLDIIQHPKYSEVRVQIDDEINDTITRTKTLWTQLMNRIKEKI